MTLMKSSQRRTKPSTKGEGSGRVPSDGFAVLMPAGVGNLKGFRGWAKSNAFPDHGKISFLHGEILVDMSPERLESHGLVKGEITRVLFNLVRKTKSGIF